MAILFGYTHVGPEISRCPCGDPGNYMSCEQDDEDALELLFRCWCGSKLRARADSLAEVEALRGRYARG